MSYDPALGTGKRSTFSPGSAADAPWKAERLALYTSGAAIVIGFNHAMSALLDLNSASIAVVSSNGHVQALANVAGLLIAALFAVWSYRRQPPLVALAVLAWSILECDVPLTRHLYAHVSFLRLSIMMVFIAIAGVRGAFSLKRYTASGEFSRLTPEDGRSGPLVL